MNIRGNILFTTGCCQNPWNSVSSILWRTASRIQRGCQILAYGGEGGVYTTFRVCCVCVCPCVLGRRMANLEKLSGEKEISLHMLFPFLERSFPFTCLEKSNSTCQGECKRLLQDTLTVPLRWTHVLPFLYPPYSWRKFKKMLATHIQLLTYLLLWVELYPCIKDTLEL